MMTHNEDWYRGVILIKNIGVSDVQMVKRTGRAYNKPGPAKAWVTIHRKEYPSKRGGRRHEVYESYIEKAGAWHKVGD